MFFRGGGEKGSNKTCLMIDEYLTSFKREVVEIKKYLTIFTFHMNPYHTFSHSYSLQVFRDILSIRQLFSQFL